MSAKVSSRATFFEKFGLSLVSWQSVLAAAMLLFAMCSLWLFFDRSRLRHEQEQLRAESQSRQNREDALSQQLAAAKAETQKVESENERLRIERNGNAQPATQPERTQRPAIYSLLLSPVLIRGGGNPQTATIPSQTDLVRLQMKVDQENRGGFQVRVRTVEGRQVWEQQIKPHARSSIITAPIPAGRLPLGDYILTLSATTPTGQPEEVNRYFFRVIRQ